MNDPIKVKKENSILEVTIDRPKANAIDAKTSIILGDIFADFRDNPKLKVAIVTGSGEKFFSAGWDLKAVNEGEAADADYGVGGFGGLQELPNMNKPIISAVNGIACGGGFEIMISADIIIAADHATFALPEINVGVIADAATIKLRRRIPYHVAVEFLMTGRWMDVKEAKHWGLINEIINKINFSEHHFSHAASAFYPSPFKEAIVLTMDGVGEWTTTSVYLGKKNSLKLLITFTFIFSIIFLKLSFLISIFSIILI